MHRLKKSKLKFFVSWFLNSFVRRYNFLFHPVLTRSRCLILCGGKVLLVKNFIGSTKWSLPGGGAKRGESYKKAAIREVKEELEIDISHVKSLGIFTVNEPEYTLLAHTFVAITDTENIRPSTWELLDAGWFDIDNLAMDISPLVSMALNAYNRKKQLAGVEKVTTTPIE